MKYSDIYRLYSTSQPKDAIHQALRKCPSMTATNSTKTVLRCILPASMETRRVKDTFERDAEPNTKDANGFDSYPRQNQCRLCR